MRATTGCPQSASGKTGNGGASLDGLTPEQKTAIATATPLWFYILREAELPPYNTERLGAVGGRIMAEVIVGLLQRDPNSYLYLDPAWKPVAPLAPTAGSFTFADLLRFAGAA